MAVGIFYGRNGITLYLFHSTFYVFNNALGLRIDNMTKHMLYSIKRKI